MNIAGKDYDPTKIVRSAKNASSLYGFICAISSIFTILSFVREPRFYPIDLASVYLWEMFIVVFGRQTFPHPSQAEMLAVKIFGGTGAVAIIAVFLVVWLLARRGSKPAYVLGMVLYALDSALLFISPRFFWLGIIFHLILLWLLWGGYVFVKARKPAELLLAG